jgi:hypothetical protein
MVAGRHNLTRRALLGAGVGAWAEGQGLGRVPPVPGAGPTASDAGAARGHGQVHVPDDPRWTRALAAYRRAEARVAAFKAEEARLPLARRAFPACADLEERFGELDDRRFAALRRLLRLPAPDLAALTLKLDLAIADQAWELTGAEDCLAAIAADAGRLARGG